MILIVDTHCQGPRSSKVEKLEREPQFKVMRTQITYLYKNNNLY